MRYFLYTIIYILVFCMGVTVFSYLNLVIERLPKKETLTIRHVHCKQCDHEQTWKDVIPIFSRIRYQNRCRYCGCTLPIRPLIIELFGGAFAVLSFALYGIHLSTVLFFLVICDLMVITMIDADTQEIPPQLNVILLLLGIPSIWLLPGPTIVERVIGLFAVSVPMFILMLFNGFGGGDVKMMFATGFLLGWKGNVAAFFIGVIVGGVYAIYLLASKKKGRKEHFAFGPFLAFGILVALAHNFGDMLISTYIDYVKSMMTATY